MTIKEIRALTGLIQKEFSQKYKIPLHTLTNWEQGIRKCPQYLIDLLEFKVKEDLKMANISPEEFYQKMLKIKEDKEYDKEGVHREMDDLVCEVLESLGYEKGINVFNDTDKWYS